MFAMPLSAQAASYTYINQKAPYKNQNPPMLTALNLPKVGTTFKVQVLATQSLSPTYLAFGVSNPNVPIPAWNGYVFTSAEIVVPTPSRSGWLSMTTMSFPIPNSPGLLGVRFHQQVFNASVNPWTGWVWFRLSRGGVGVIGK